MSEAKWLEIMAYADGELDAARTADIERLLANDADAAALHRELAGIRALVRGHEPAGKVADSREFYWSQIRQRIAAEEPVQRRASSGSASRLTWLRWLVPALGLAAIGLVLVVQQQPVGRGITDNASATEAGAMTFTSDADGVTIRWIN
jgi:anti-sigma factor RsiW